MGGTGTLASDICSSLIGTNLHLYTLMHGGREVT